MKNAPVISAELEHKEPFIIFIGLVTFLDLGNSDSYWRIKYWIFFFILLPEIATHKEGKTNKSFNVVYSR